MELLEDSAASSRLPLPPRTWQTSQLPAAEAQRTDTTCVLCETTETSETAQASPCWLSFILSSHHCHVMIAVLIWNACTAMLAASLRSFPDIPLLHSVIHQPQLETQAASIQLMASTSAAAVLNTMSFLFGCCWPLPLGCHIWASCLQSPPADGSTVCTCRPLPARV